MTKESGNALEEYFKLLKIFKQVSFVYSFYQNLNKKELKSFQKRLEEVFKKNSKEELFKDLMSLFDRRNSKKRISLKGTKLFQELEKVKKFIEKMKPSIHKSKSAVNISAHIYKKDIFEIEECLGNGFFDLLTLNKEQVPNELITSYKLYYKKEFKKNRRDEGELSLSTFYPNELFTLISHYKFHKCFLPDDLLPIFKEVEDEITLKLSDVYPDAFDIINFSRDLFYLSRSQTLTSKFNDTIQKFVYVLFKEQTDDGLWSENYLDCEANDFYIILFSLLIFRLYPYPFSDEDKMKKLTQWIIDKQKQDGSWDDSDSSKNIFITVCAIEVLIRSGVDPEDNKIEKAVNYLIESQNVDGLWSEPESIPDVGGCTAIVLDLIKNYKFFQKPRRARNFVTQFNC